MYEKMYSLLPGLPMFLLCLLPERKNSDLYGPWKRKNLWLGVVTQCIAPTTARVNDQYLTNVLTKINAKLGGLNSVRLIEHTRSIPIVSPFPTMILGMTESHGSPGQPSIAAVVSSRNWPLISKYRASVCIQTPKVETIDNLFKPVSNNDEGIIRELLMDFDTTSVFKPSVIIIFRDGVSESQFTKVLDIEVKQIAEACASIEEWWKPCFVVIVAQKCHHTKIFQASSHDNVPPGTAVDNTCHPHPGIYNFYLCAHAGMVGNTRPTHYHVLLDEIGFKPADLQEFVHWLSYVDQRSTTAISVVAPLRYAHLAATQMRKVCSSCGGLPSAQAVPASELLQKLNQDCCTSEFFF